MWSDVIVGVVATIVFMAVFLLWAYHELRRIDDYIAADDDSEGGLS